MAHEINFSIVTPVHSPYMPPENLVKTTLIFQRSVLNEELHVAIGKRDLAHVTAIFELEIYNHAPPVLRDIMGSDHQHTILLIQDYLKPNKLLEREQPYAVTLDRNDGDMNFPSEEMDLTALAFSRILAQFEPNETTEAIYQMTLQFIQPPLSEDQYEKILSTLSSISAKNYVLLKEVKEVKVLAAEEELEGEPAGIPHY